METGTMVNYNVPKSLDHKIYKMDFWGAQAGKRRQRKGEKYRSDQ